MNNFSRRTALHLGLLAALALVPSLPGSISAPALSARCAAGLAMLRSDWLTLLWGVWAMLLIVYVILCWLDWG